MSRRIQLLAVSICIVMIIIGCSSSPPSADEAVTGDTSNQAAAPTDNIATDNPAAAPQTTDLPGTVVATVNGEPIMRAELDREFARYQTGSTVTDRRALQVQMLETLIEQEVINQAARQMGIIVTEDDVQSELANLRASASSDTEWQAFLSMNGYTEAEMIDAQRDSLVTQRVRNQLMQQYEGNVSQVRARHILVQEEDTANAVLDKLAAGEGFVDLAIEYSIDSTSNQSGGDLGWFTREELTDERLADVAFSTPPNEIRGPVRSSLGYHIVQTLAAEDRPIEPERLPVLAENVFNNWLSDQLQQATIERNL